MNRNIIFLFVLILILPSIIAVTPNDFSWDFDNGALGNVEQDINDENTFYLTVDNYDFDNSWLYFKIDNVKDKELKFIIENTNDSGFFRYDDYDALGSGIFFNQYIYKSRKIKTDKNILYSYDKINWHRFDDSYYTMKSWSDTDPKYTFHNKFIEDEVWISVSYPYTYYDYINDMLKLSYIDDDYVNVIKIGHSTQNRDIFLVEITDPKISMDDKKNIYIVTRQHPSEVEGDYVVKGMIQYLISDDAKELREKYKFNIIPMPNPDGVYLGYSYNLPFSGGHMNEYWGTPEQDDLNGHTKNVYNSPETTAIYDRMMSDMPINMLIDIHSTQWLDYKLYLTEKDYDIDDWYSDDKSILHRKLNDKFGYEKWEWDYVNAFDRTLSRFGYDTLKAYSLTIEYGVSDINNTIETLENEGKLYVESFDSFFKDENLIGYQSKEIDDKGENGIIIGIILIAVIAVLVLSYHKFYK